MKLPLPPLSRALKAAVAVLACAAGAAAGAPSAPSWRGGWYHIEAIVFQRPAVSAATAAEGLLTEAPRLWPATLLSLAAPGGDRAVYYEDPDQAGAEPGSCRVVAAAPGAAAGAVPAAFGATAQPYRPATEHGTAAEAVAAAASASPVTEPAVAEPMPAAPEATEPTPEQQLQALLERYEAQLQDASLQWLPDESLTLGSEAARLRAGGYVVLWQRRWLQDVPVRGAPQPIQIATDLPGGPDGPLSGTLQITRGRFMHVDATLWYEASDPTEARAYMLLQERRRMRLGELHYLDHPKLGVLIRTTRVGLPDSILTAFAALQLEPAVEQPESDDEFTDPTDADLLDL
jgi:hypothetical protein